MTQTAVQSKGRDGPVKERSAEVSLDAAAALLDRYAHALFGRAVGRLPAPALQLAWLDWALSMARSPGKQCALWHQWAQAFLPVMPQTEPGSVGDTAELDHSVDPRFADPAWGRWPFNLLRDAFFEMESFWKNATTGLQGVTPHHEHMVSFAARQWTDMLSPSNCWWLNPEVLREMMGTGGRNFIEGGRRWLDDQQEVLAGYSPRTSPRRCIAHCVGQHVAITPGKVVYRNELIELIRYTPQTTTVWPEPLLIVPSWILKYYILDLSPHNSLVRYLVERGHTVYMVSWKNPREDARDLGLDDYLERGIFDAVTQVCRASGAASIHAAGYCLGGTLLAIAAAALARDSATPLRTITLFAAQTDFSEPGELGLYVGWNELADLDALMWDQGCLEGTQMARAFQLLHSRDLIWSRMMREYLLGKHTVPTDLMAWNADTTRLPYRMHSETLRELYLRNALAEGGYYVRGRAVALADVRLPTFVVGTERDHVSPWRSVYKLHLMSNAEISFLLTSGGHNAGIISEPGHPGRRYRFSTRRKNAPYLDPDEWYAQAVVHEGSWWPRWQHWLMAHSGEKIASGAAPVESGLCDAPGTYVLEP
ncbi:Poly(3-hydroxybutyrate) polymerase [Paraburkholderia ribeironis]|uniref:Poly(3-hydroxybutyrate) polymerase n=1 Tax=Paraburkholderia ribeironis TaxID=1247936 RepID=A0A1N7RZ52_9BURK|nr:alpha/beta fold hydrolase [Paraburkholderia ribeironis]SIT39995.1 Poly(3-hydroxybutyrate) polymerase [Paraburkholderia ribeironis]